MMPDDLLPTGVYHGAITHWGLYENEKGNTSFRVQVRLDQAEDSESGTLTTLDVPHLATVVLWLTPAALPQTIAILLYLGFKHRDIRLLDPRQEGAFDFGGLEVAVKIKYADFNGFTKEEARILRRPRQVEEIKTSQRDAFADAMGAEGVPDQATSTPSKDTYGNSHSR